MQMKDSFSAKKIPVKGKYIYEFKGFTFCAERFIMEGENAYETWEKKN